MHSLETLYYINESNHAEYERKKSVTPIEVLKERITVFRPPAIDVLISRFSGVEEYNDFVKLIRRYLPEREADILSNTSPVAQMASFASFFEDRYLPLHRVFREGFIENEYSEILRDIPVYTIGFGWEDYESLHDSRLGCQLMSYIFAPPFEGDKAQQNVRISLADGFPSAYSEAVKLLPETGIGLDVARKIFKGKKWARLLNWAKYINQVTNNWFLDTDDEMRSNCMLMDWFEDGIIDAMTADWTVAERIYDEMMDFAAYLEDDKEGPSRFKKIVDFILAHIPKVGEDEKETN